MGGGGGGLGGTKKKTFEKRNVSSDSLAARLFFLPCLLTCQRGQS